MLLQHPNTVQVRRDGFEETLTFADVLNDQEYRKNLPLVGDFAVLCANAYFDNTIDGDRSKDFVHPRKTKLPDPEGWTFAFQFTSDDVAEETKRKFTINTLKGDVWLRKEESGRYLIAIVFRGSAKGWDWWTNLKWVTQFLPFFGKDHYWQVRNYIPTIIEKALEAVKSEGGDPENVEIISTGHSLGGGLAQLAGYTSPKIEHVFAFNSSPVTAFYTVRKKVRDENKKEMKIYRLFEHGEVLAFVRLFLRFIYRVSKAEPRIVEVRFNFDQGNLAKEHGMWGMAKKLAFIFEEGEVLKKKENLSFGTNLFVILASLAFALYMKFWNPELLVPYGYVLMGAWAIIPPLWFLYEYTNEFPRYWKNKPENMMRLKHLQDLSRTLWLAFVAVLFLLLGLEWPVNLG